MVALTVGEVALALLLTWLLFRSNFAQHASDSFRLGAGDLLVLAAMAACLALFVFVLAVWQWRMSGRARWRLVLAVFLSLLWSFCGFCWHDVSLRGAKLPGAPPVREQIVEQTAAVSVTMGALVAGLIAVIIVLALERKTLNSRSGGAIVRDTSTDRKGDRP